MTFKDPYAHLTFFQKMIRGGLGTLGIFAVFGIGYLIFGGGNASTTAPNSGSQATAQEHRLIPGIMPSDVYLNFKNKGFDCGKIQVAVMDGVSQHSWTCTQEVAADHNYTVQIFGEGGVQNVLSVVATSLNFGQRDTNTVAKSFLGYAASLTYEGATPEEARGWVEKNVGKNTDNLFTGVKYELVSNARARILTISMPDRIVTTSTVR